MNQSNISINAHSNLGKEREEKERAPSEYSQSRLKKTLTNMEYGVKKQGQSERSGGLFTGLKSSQIDLNNLLKKAGYRINGAALPNGNSYKESTGAERSSPKGNLLLVNKITGTGTGAPLFGPKASSPKGGSSMKNVFIPSSKEYSKLKTGKSPKRKVDTSTNKKSQLQSQTPLQGTISSKPLQSNLAKLLFGNTHLSKLLKQPQANHLWSKPEKKTKNGSSSHLKEGKLDKEGPICTSRSKRLQK